MKRVLNDTLELALSKDDSFPARFYELLFAKHPETRELFYRSSPGAQRKMFAQKLAAIVDHIDDKLWLDREIIAIGISHLSYGVTAEMYAWVGEALIQTLREACAEEWSDEAERAWTTAYDSLARAILAAAPHS